MKTKEQPIQEQDYEYALRALDDREFRLSKEFIVWLEEESHRILFREMMDSREALMNLNPPMTPDMEKAWRRVDPHRKVSSAKSFYVWAASAAAVALLIIGYSFFSATEEIPRAETAVVFPAAENGQSVELQTGDGQVVPITDLTDKQLIAHTGAQLTDESLRYQNATQAEEPVDIHILSTPRGRNFKLVLEDGTEVWLNTESKLHYPNRFTGNERKVELEGEAFFHVAKDAAHPFVVKSGTAETRVLGTEFNFRAYPDESRHVTLVSGSVIVSDSRKENELRLAPGESVPLDENDSMLIPRKVDIEEYIAWKEDLFCFREAQLVEIMKAIGRWYNLAIVFTDEASMHYHFNFWAERTDSPEQVLKLLNQVGKVKATLEGDRITISKL